MSRCYTQITLADRRRLHHLVAAKVPVNEMARQLGRHRSTIYREIKRNTFHDRELPDYDGYYSTEARPQARPADGLHERPGGDCQKAEGAGADGSGGMNWQR